MSRLPLRPFLATAFLIATPAVAESPLRFCDPQSNRCTSTATMTDDAGATFATLTLQLDKDGSNPVLYSAIPLGVAARPGVRVVAQPGAAEITLAIDACFPDSCRASNELTAEQLATLAAAESLSVQFIPFTTGKTVAGDLPAASLLSPLRDEGVTLP